MVSALLFFLFFLSIITLSLASVNIDCGTSSSAIDNNNIKWVGDKDFITSGVSATVSSTTIDKHLTTLRYFPTGDSNCYTNIPVAKGGKVLVRTRFYYGNYDGKFSSPSFTVVFEGNRQENPYIASAFVSYFYELIFSPAGEETSVCFVRTSSSSNPFVSSIEVFDLDDGMYDELDPDEGLFYHRRIAYGTTEYLRSDPQGRFWPPSEVNMLLTGSPSSAISIDTSGASNKPPESVLHNSWSMEGMTLVDETLPSKVFPFYLAMYFSEPFPTGVRSFNVFLDGKQVNKVPVVPLYGKVTQLVLRDVVANPSTQLVFMSTTFGALLPPFINAAELYVISKATNVSGGGGSGSGGSHGGGGGGGDSGNGGSGSSGSGGNGNGGTGGRNENSSGGSTNGKNSKLPIILGVVSAVAFVLFAYVVIAFVLTNRRKARLQALPFPTSTVVHMGTGAFGEAMGNSSTQPTTEGDMGDHSYVVEQ